MRGNYFIIDGSALTAQIRQLQRAEPTFRQRKLCPRRFIGSFISELPELHGGEYKRATFYFPKGDETAIEDYLVMPDRRKPGEVRDLHFKFCGYKLKKSADFDKFVEEQVPSKWHDRFAKSEKGVDIEMCCDALRLASASQVERVFLLTNDGDFLPFCRTLKEFGANISIIHLSSAGSPNADLLREADSFDVVPDHQLQELFFPELDLTQLTAAHSKDAATADGGAGDQAQSEKPAAIPSDLVIDASVSNEQISKE